MFSTVVAMTALLVGAEGKVPEELKTVAEKSQYKATARYADVVALGQRLASASKSVSIAELGKTVEGRAIPLWILADPPVATPSQAVQSGKMVVLLVGNIHAGEVCGKEALPMLARELIERPGHPLFKDLIIAMVPIYNADGNERVSKDNRPGQVGPEEGMGIRPNAQGLDLNRDFMKLEAPETRALVKFLNEWDPALVVDTHTTNGSHHRYTITYEGPKNPAGDHRLIEFARGEMFPELTRAFESQTHLRAYFYGNFNAEHTEWTSFPGVPRFGTTYIGLRNQLSILSEAYAYAPFSTRVSATRDFVRASLLFASTHRKAIERLLSQARSGSIALGESPAPRDLVAIRSEPHPFVEPASVLGYVEEIKSGKAVSTGVPKDYRVSVLQDFRPSATVRRPFAYLVPARYTEVLANLKAHGLALEPLSKELELEVDVYRIESATRSKALFEGHHTLDVSVSARSEKRRVPLDTVVVRTAQPLGALAVYLLEPHSDDGLCTWNFFDDAIDVGKDFPVFRVATRVALPSK